VQVKRPGFIGELDPIANAHIRSFGRYNDQIKGTE
jgi:hypothetical protein